MFSVPPRGSASAWFARVAARSCGILAIVLLCSLTGGCYLLESAQGQLALLSKRQPIDQVIGKTSTPPVLRQELEEVTAIRDFATRELGLPNNGSYRSYADVGRPYVVWTVAEHDGGMTPIRSICSFVRMTTVTASIN
jgi:predicted aminopeptidase